MTPRSTAPTLAAFVLLLSFAAPDQAVLAGEGIVGPTARRGPLEIRDEYLLAQPRLTLPAVSPHTLPRGRWSFDLSVLSSNSFAWTQDEEGETPKIRLFLIDGETVSFDARLRHGLSASVDVGLALPIRHRGGGVLDGLIDTWHRLFGFQDGARPEFLHDAYRAEGRTTSDEPFSWTDKPGSGLGDLQGDVRWRVRDGGNDRLSLALVGRLSLPTATGPFAGHGLGGGGQVLFGIPLGRRFDLYAGAGATVQDPGPVDGVAYARSRGHGFVALEWRPWERVSLVLETNAGTRLVRNIAMYPGRHWLVNVGGRFDLGDSARLDVGLTENILDQQSTTDLAFYFALGVRP